MHCPYTAEKARLVVREMTDSLVLDLVELEVARHVVAGFLDVRLADFDAHAVIIGDEGRRKGHKHGIARLDEHLDLFNFAYDLLGILGAHNEALTAKTTFIADDMRLIRRKTNRFYRTVTNTFITVFTV